MFKSDKIVRVFIDTEFTSFMNCDLISIGMKAETGEEFYGENTDHNQGWASAWVKQHVYPLLNYEKYGMKYSTLSARVMAWIDDLPCKSVIIMVDYQTDYELLYCLFQDEPHDKVQGVENIYHNISSAAQGQMSLMTWSDSDYDGIVATAKEIFNDAFDEYFFTTKEIQHHALSDAKANAFAYAKLASKWQTLPH
jgi:hypothetical protein